MIVNVLVEGYSENTFIKDVLGPYLKEHHNIDMIPTIITTKIVGTGANFKGGLTNLNYHHFISDLQRLIRSTPHGIVTTFIDYYALPSKFPGYTQRTYYATPVQQVQFLQQELKNELAKEVNVGNFHPYIQLHEFEAMLFSDKVGFEMNIDPAKWNVGELVNIVNTYDNPEDINQGAETAPSKRILRHYSEYQKVIEGNYILLDIGLETVLGKCPHFNSWVQNLISLV